MRHWVGAPANSPSAPIRTVPAPQPQVVFAERKPRLSRPELLARCGVRSPMPATAGRPNLSVMHPLEGPAPQRDRLGALRLARWLLLALATLAVAASTPLS
ncbi:hypothetical protein Rumeso_02334 [Rubellimicrobium mesophilum DSM 19309]|uniref:Uncharacterized protein n=1 Tax=Rubellimicrobium mesophilum DSM 19309 TaxID=442562 RepID=A0A017HPB4_9RHOB|nr:hypothetical protein Rumeso_02334 [Rubellimicrobium mesophilum DSM 19309]